MADELTRDVPPVHQTATFDQAYAGISATIDELVASYRRIRAQNAATREIDIAGLVGYLLESPNSREAFVEHYVVAVVRLAVAEVERDEAKQVMAEEIAAIAEERMATRRENVLALIHERDALKAATEQVREVVAYARERDEHLLMRRDSTSGDKRMKRLEWERRAYEVRAMADRIDAALDTTKTPDNA